MTDWSGFIPSLIATFVGFLLALLGERIYDLYKDTKEGKELITSFKSEIQNITLLISTVESINNAMWLNPVKTPVWDSVISTNKLALLSGYSWYNSLIELYDEIKDYNEWHRMRTQLYYDGSEFNAISESLTNSECEIREKAQSLILKIDC